MDKRKFRLAVVTPVVTALVVVTIVVYLILQGAAGGGNAHEGVTYSPEMAEVADPEHANLGDSTQDTTEAACDFDQWVGNAVDEEAVKAVGRVYRILPPHAAATMDFNPERINVMIDDKGVVTAVRCG